MPILSKPAKKPLIWNFPNINKKNRKIEVINFDKYLFSNYYLEGFQNAIEQLPDNLYMLAPWYPSYNDIQYGGITETPKKREFLGNTVKRALVEEAGLDIDLCNIYYSGYNKVRGRINHFYIVDINDCEPITKEKYNGYVINPGWDDKTRKVNVFIIGEYDDLVKVTKKLYYKIDDGDGIEALAILKIGDVKKIHHHNISTYGRYRKAGQFHYDPTITDDEDYDSDNSNNVNY